jgi:hypothetical protein
MLTELTVYGINPLCRINNEVSQALYGIIESRRAGVVTRLGGTLTTRRLISRQPLKFQVNAIHAAGGGLFLVAGWWPVRWFFTPIGRPTCAPFKRTLPDRVKQHPPDIVAVIAGEPQNRVVGKDSGEGVQCFRRNDTAAIVPAFRPGVGKQNEAALDGCVRQRVDHQPRVIRYNADIFYLVLLKRLQELGDAVQVWLASN